MVELLEKELTKRRERYNSLFALARRARPRLSGETFLENLRTFVAPTIAALGTVTVEEARPLIESLYGLCLELTGSDVFHRSAATDVLWKSLMPEAVAMLVQDPLKVPAALTNAVVNLESEESPDWERWIAMMRQGLNGSSDSQEWLRFGQAASWQCGMAHFRETAWEIGNGLSGPLRSLLDPAWSQMKLDPWAPRREAITKRGPHVVARVGGFAGFGGRFSQPPWVAYSGGDRFVVEDGSQEWILSCDAFGATLKSNASTDIVVPARTDVRVDDDGLIHWREHRVAFTELAPVRSFAVADNVLAVTSDLSHAVYLFLGPGA